jgi:hypothetical protein
MHPPRRRHRHPGKVFDVPPLIAEDTVKEEILALQQQTRDLVDAILVQDSALIRRLTAEGLDSALS